MTFCRSTVFLSAAELELEFDAAMELIVALEFELVLDAGFELNAVLDEAFELEIVLDVVLALETPLELIAALEIALDVLALAFTLEKILDVAAEPGFVAGPVMIRLELAAELALPSVRTVKGAETLELFPERSTAVIV